MNTDQLLQFVSAYDSDKDSANLIDKVLQKKRLTKSEGLKFYSLDLGLLGILANYIKESKNQNLVYFNRNIHIEPTNICVYKCKFCAYHRKEGDEGSWEFSIDEMLEKLKPYKNSGLTEVHIVGGVHPNRDLHYYGKLIQEIKKFDSNIHIKAFTAVELDFMIKKAGLELDEGLLKLKEYGLDSIPGGGAEIFDDKIRKELCYEKSSSDKWLQIHERAHINGIPSNATMLYGHLESFEQRVHHLDVLRELQDRTNGFNTFIPLKFKRANNHLSYLNEVNSIEDMKNYAVSRLYLDNFDHIKAYWPMIGKESAQMSLSFGVDDVDGTIDDSTKIYSMAGAEDQKPSLSTDEVVELIQQTNRIPVERDTLYNIVKKYN